MKLSARSIGMRAQAPGWRTAFGALIISFLPVAMSGQAAETGINEFTIKAAYISKFGGFIRWPEGTFSSDTSPITICILGDTPVGAALAKVTARPIGTHPVVIRTLKTFAPGDGCHILYAADTDANRVKQVLKSAHGASVLTVTDIAGGGTASVINFVVRDNRIKFEIDEQAASEGGLTISSQLLGLAVSVRARESS